MKLTNHKQYDKVYELTHSLGKDLPEGLQFGLKGTALFVTEPGGLVRELYAIPEYVVAMTQEGHWTQIYPKLSKPKAEKPASKKVAKKTKKA